VLPPAQSGQNRIAARAQAQDHIVNQVTHYERLRNTKQRGHQDEEDTHCTLAVVSANKRAQVLEAGLHGPVAVLTTNAVFRELSRKPRF
jgi:hypothetical protein